MIWKRKAWLNSLLKLVVTKNTSMSLSKKSNSKYSPKQENSILKAEVVIADISAYPADIYF